VTAAILPGAAASIEPPRLPDGVFEDVASKRPQYDPQCEEPNTDTEGKAERRVNVPQSHAHGPL
jgi:hypothetical protein